MSTLACERRWRSVWPAAGFLAAVVSILLATPATVQAQLAKVETEKMRLVYVDGTESYLVPHAARTFLNSLEFQRRLFGFEPHEKITVLLVDFSDSGNAGASVVARNVVTVQIAPLSFEFETIAANERMNTIMNHELVHIATMDQAAKKDRVFRRLFGGKVNPVSAHPESMFYFFLTTPRVAAPRWYHEGIAVFIDTWMAGGLGRAQSGYDEMVFRAMVRDDAPFYDPLGLVSEGTKIDFQLQINSYLYGTRFMTWLARQYSPEKVVTWLSRRDGSRAYYSAAVQAGVRPVARSRRGRHGLPTSGRSSRRTSRRFASIRRRRIATSRHGRSDRSRAPTTTPATKKIYAAFNYPGVVAHVGAISADSGAVEQIVDIKGPVDLHGDVACLRSRRPDALLHDRQRRVSRPRLGRSGDAPHARFSRRTPASAISRSTGPSKSLWGIRHLNGILLARADRAAVPRVGAVVSWPYGTVVYDLDVSPDGRQVVASFGEITGQQDVRVLATEALARGDATPVARVSTSARRCRRVRVLARRAIPLRQRRTTRASSNIFRYEIATREARGRDQHRDRLLPAGAARRRSSSSCSATRARASCRRRIDARPLEDVSPITFLGERLADRASSRQELERRVAG